jgi:aspartate/methionine/tyrosine aminotransferase
MVGLDELLKLHKKLDYDCRHRNGRIFVSDWYCEHDFASQIIPQAARTITDKQLLPYYFQNDNDSIHEEIVKFHKARGERPLSKKQIFVSAGLSSLITAQMLMLRRMGVDVLYYVRPLYYTYYFLSNLLGVKLIPVNDKPLLDETSVLGLPTAPRSALVLCDPVWFLGRPISAAAITKLQSWQTSTGSLILVDGAFQYLRWSGNRLPELTASLSPELTIRNICPTKLAALHGPRFAYSILPENLWEDVRYCYSNTAGSGSVFDMPAALSIMKWLNSRESNDGLIDFIRQRHSQLADGGAFTDRIGAKASYFCFVTVPVSLKKLIIMDQRFFDTESFPRHVRFNVILPKAGLKQYLGLVIDKLTALGKQTASLRAIQESL